MKNSPNTPPTRRWVRDSNTTFLKKLSQDAFVKRFKREKIARDNNEEKIIASSHRNICVYTYVERGEFFPGPADDNQRDRFLNRTLKKREVAFALGVSLTTFSILEESDLIVEPYTLNNLNYLMACSRRTPLTRNNIPLFLDMQKLQKALTSAHHIIEQLEKDLIKAKESPQSTRKKSTLSPENETHAMRGRFLARFMAGKGIGLDEVFKFDAPRPNERHPQFKYFNQQNPKKIQAGGKACWALEMLAPVAQSIEQGDPRKLDGLSFNTSKTLTNRYPQVALFLTAVHPQAILNALHDTQLPANDSQDYNSLYRGEGFANIILMVLEQMIPDENIAETTLNTLDDEGMLLPFENMDIDQTIITILDAVAVPDNEWKGIDDDTPIKVIYEPDAEAETAHMIEDIQAKSAEVSAEHGVEMKEWDNT